MLSNRITEPNVPQLANHDNKAYVEGTLLSLEHLLIETLQKKKKKI